MTSTRHHIKRTLPFLKVLLNSPTSRRAAILKTFPQFVVDDIVEILYNVVYGNVKIRNGQYKKVLKNEKAPLLKLIKLAPKKHMRRRFIYKQSGGFIGALLPIIASIATGILSRNVWIRQDDTDSNDKESTVP